MEKALQNEEVDHEGSSLNSRPARSSDSNTEVDSSPSSPGIALFSVPIHSLTSQCRHVHGLKHGDFEGYRRYCTRRLRRLRSSQDVRFMLSKGKQWIKGKKVEVSDVINSNYLLIPLLMTERAWAHAMSMKKMSTKESWNARSRQHVQRRLSKAVKLVKQLEDLCSKTCDERTSLEVTAYASWMKGDRELDREHWEVAFMELTTAARIYGELATVGSLAEQDMFSICAEEIRPSLRYCKFKVDREVPDSRCFLAEKGAVNSVLAARLSSVISKAQKERTASLDHVNWQGWKIPLRSEQLKDAISSFNSSVSLLKEQRDEMEQSDSSVFEDLYLSACNAHDDATTIIHDELADLANQGMGSRVETQRAELAGIGDFILHSKLTIMIRWNEDLIDQLLAEQEPVQPAVIVHIYDAILQNVRDLCKCLERVTADGDDSLTDDPLETLDRISYDEALYRTSRCYFLGEVYYEWRKWDEATVLFRHASVLCSDAFSREKAFIPLSSGVGDDDASERRLTKLSKLQSLISGALIRTKAKAYLHSNASTATMCSMVGGSEATDAAAALPFISERLSTYSCCPTSQGFGIAPFPPRIEPAIAHPLLLDTALDLMPCPQFKNEAGLLEVSQNDPDSGIMNWFKFW